MTPIIKPKRLVTGDTIGIVAPSSPPKEASDIDNAIEKIKSLGFQVKAGKHLYDRYGYLAGTDQDRADDINQMFADDEVDGIILLRSGHGSARLLPLIDYGLIRRKPKVISGMSDITSLLNAIHQQTGLVTFNGPEAIDDYGPYMLAEFQKVLMSAQPAGQIGNLPADVKLDGNEDWDSPLNTIVPGQAKGRLVGGTLTLITSLLGTPYQPDFQNSILFLEEIGGHTDEVDRNMTQLWLAGVFNQIAGIVFGRFVEISLLKAWTSHLSLKDVLTERCIPANKPAAIGLMFGHIDEFTTIPIGCEAELDADACTLTLLENAVR